MTTTTSDQDGNSTRPTKGAVKERGIRPIGPGRWRVRVHAGRDSSGKVVQRSRSVTSGIKEARRVRSELEAEVAQSAEDRLVRHVEAQSFGNLLDRWLAHGRKRDRSPSTIDGYEKKIRRRIRPSLGHFRLDEITTRTLDDWYNELLDEGATPANVMAFLRIIAAALRQGKKWEDIVVSPARNASPPSVPHKEIVTPSAAQVKALLDLTEESPATLHWGELILVACLTGMRRGELCAVQWGDIDWQRSTVTVRHAIWQTSAVPSEGRPAKWGVKDPKTHQIRRLECGPAAMALLRRRL